MLDRPRPRADHSETDKRDGCSKSNEKRAQEECGPRSPREVFLFTEPHDSPKKVASISPEVAQEDQHAPGLKIHSQPHCHRPFLDRAKPEPGANRRDQKTEQDDSKYDIPRCRRLPRVALVALCHLKRRSCHRDLTDQHAVRLGSRRSNSELSGGTA